MAQSSSGQVSIFQKWHNGLGPTHAGSGNKALGEQALSQPWWCKKKERVQKE